MYTCPSWALLQDLHVTSCNFQVSRAGGTIALSLGLPESTLTSQCTWRGSHRKHRSLIYTFHIWLLDTSSFCLLFFKNLLKSKVRKDFCNWTKIHKETVKVSKTASWYFAKMKQQYRSQILCYNLHISLFYMINIMFKCIM